ncbi:hypothetical protein [Pseudalkalibacillus sp. SCS-8]|uniref:PilN domain-containing protein n=1 Tax=Pseudalkalibacillus nanhaiensis TaxID=3115291 RepID=UPI0032DB739E
MQVDINLLPQKKKKIVRRTRRSSVILVVVALTGVILLAFSAYWTNSEVKKLESERSTLEAKSTEIGNKLSEMAQDSTAFKQEVDRVFSERMETTRVVDDVFQPLAKDALVNISFTNDGRIQVLAQFQRLEDVAAYQQKLAETPGILGVQLLKLTKNEADKEKAAKVKKYTADYDVKYDPTTYSNEGGTP